MIRAHGGTLVNRVLSPHKAAEAAERAKRLPRLALSNDMLQQVENIARGIFSPLEGFLGEKDYKFVLNEKRLVSGVPWTIPIVLDVDPPEAQNLRGETALTDAQGEVYALLEVEDVYTYDKQEFATKVYGTDDQSHPGVARTLAMKDRLVAGTIDLLRTLPSPFDRHKLSPRETRVLFEHKGWKTVCAFQTRNVPHRGHENLQKTVLGLVDGLMVQPVIGRKKKGDFKDHLIIASYERLIEVYYNKARVVLTILPFEMRYAGPREAILHAIMRKNYGCTHIIIGRDHAGVGKFYHPEAAIEIFNEFPDIEITPISIRGDFFYCNTCGAIESDRTTSTPPEDHIEFSGTAIRNMIIKGAPPPTEIMRPEVFEVIHRDPQPFIE